MCCYCKYFPYWYMCCYSKYFPYWHICCYCKYFSYYIFLLPRALAVVSLNVIDVTLLQTHSVVWKCTWAKVTRRLTPRCWGSRRSAQRAPLPPPSWTAAGRRSGRRRRSQSLLSNPHHHLHPPYGAKAVTRYSAAFGSVKNNCALTAMLQQLTTNKWHRRCSLVLLLYKNHLEYIYIHLASYHHPNVSIHS